MASHNALLRDNFPAGADMTGKEYTLVKLNSSGNLVSCAAGDAGFVLVNEPLSGENGTVDLVGITKVKLGGTVAVMDVLTSNASGVAVVASTTGHAISLRALSAGVSGDIIPALITTLGKA